MTKALWRVVLAAQVISMVLFYGVGVWHGSMFFPPKPRLQIVEIEKQVPVMLPTRADKRFDVQKLALAIPASALTNNGGK